jgi:hypothetical protein
MLHFYLELIKIISHKILEKAFSLILCLQAPVSNAPLRVSEAVTGLKPLDTVV